MKRAPTQGNRGRWLIALVATGICAVGVGGLPQATAERPQGGPQAGETSPPRSAGLPPGGPTGGGPTAESAASTATSAGTVGTGAAGLAQNGAGPRSGARTAPWAASGAVTSTAAVDMPPGFVVTQFDDRTRIPSLGWLAVAAPFMLAERVEHHLPLRPAYDQWVLPRGKAPPISADAIAAHANRVGATWVFTGWIDGGRAAIELGMRLWRVSDGMATFVGEVVRQAPIEQFFSMLGEVGGALAEPVWGRRGAEFSTVLATPPTADFYAFTIFGRGLLELAAAADGSQDDQWRLQRALRQFGRAILIDPQLAEAQRILGEVHRARNRNGPARDRIGAALRIKPGYIPALATRAMLARADGEWGRAERLYREVLRFRPWDIQRRYELGSLLWDQERIDDARSELERVIASNPDHLEARRILVRIHSRRRDHSALLDELEALLRIDDTDVDSRFDLAAVYTAVGRERDAARVYEALSSVPAARARALKFLGDIYRRRGDTETAVGYYSRALQVDSDDPRLHFLLGGLYLETADEASAQRMFRRALRFRGYAAPAHNNLGAMAYRHGRHQEAMRHLRSAVNMRPNSVRYRYNYALTLSAAGFPGRALVQISAGLRKAPNHPDLHYLLGVVKVRLGKPDEARTSFENALRLRPDHADALHNLTKLERGWRPQPTTTIEPPAL